METSTVRALLDVLPEATLCVNASRCVAVVSTRMEALCGWSRAELLGRAVQLLFPRSVREGLGFLLEAGQPDDEACEAEPASELYLLHKDGRELPVRLRRSLLETEEGCFLCLSLREGEERPAAEGTERRVIDALRESHRRVTGMLESITDGMISVDREWRVIYVSPRAEWLLGRWRGDLLGRSLWDAFPRSVGSHFYRQYHRAVAERVSVHFEEYSITLDRWFEVNAFPTEEGLSVYFRDIHERKQSEAALRRGREWLELAHGAGGIGAWEWDLQGDRASWSDSYYALLGLTPQAEASYTLWLQLVHPDDLDYTRRRFTDIRAGGRFTSEYRIIRPDGDVRWTYNVGTCDLDAAGQPQRIIGMSVDVTERKLAEFALRDSEERYRSLVDNATDMIYSHDLAGRFLSVNRAGEAITGYTQAELLQMTLLDLVAPEYWDLLRQRADDRILHGNTARTTCELELVARDGRRIPVEVSSAPLIQDGRTVALQGIARDITERVSLEEQLRQAQKMEAVGRLAGGVAHDFNNMLAVINGYSELCLGEVGPESAWHEPLRQIHRAGERAAALTRQLLAFSRKQMLRPVLLDLNQVVSDTHTMLSRLIGEDILLGTRLASDLGRISADPSQVEQVILNLAVNARDAMPRGGRLTLTTRNVELEPAAVRAHAGQAPGLYVLLEVSDTGCGMSPETQERIFEPFFTTKGPGEGTGLGLATVYGIVSQSGGHLEVESVPEVGSTFRIYLPRVAEFAEEPPATPAPEALPGSETILLVEDEPMVRVLLRSILEEYGYRVLEAGTAEELERVRTGHREPIDLLITDVVMPALSGPEVSALLRAQYPDLKVLYISGYTDDAVLRHGVSTAEAAFLQKPFSPATLAQKVRELLN